MSESLCPFSWVRHDTYIPRLATLVTPSAPFPERRNRSCVLNQCTMQSYVPLIHVNAGYLYLTPQSDPPAVTLKKKTLYKPRGRVAASSTPYL
jgi:hypothetical protein